MKEEESRIFRSNLKNKRLIGKSQNGGQTPMIMTNVTMETYIQKISCLDCHIGAGINHFKDGQEYASDYSFIFGMAQTQEATATDSEKKMKVKK